MLKNKQKAWRRPEVQARVRKDTLVATIKLALPGWDYRVEQLSVTGLTRYRIGRIGRSAEAMAGAVIKGATTPLFAKLMHRFYLRQAGAI